jgi:hypothetical protein
VIKVTDRVYVPPLRRSVQAITKHGEASGEDKMDDFFTRLASSSNSHGCYSLTRSLFPVR